jgi:hypothetical protein
MPDGPLLIEDDNISRAWVRAFEALVDPGVHGLTPLVVTVRLPPGRALPVVPAVTTTLDEVLVSHGMPRCGTTANLIFPSIWNPARPRRELFERYMRMLPRIRRDPRNRDGVYFERLIAYGDAGSPRNQLEYIISTYSGGNHRHSALQASILDPGRDQTNQRQRGFPCLQQVSFLPSPHSGLAVTGYYATQYLVDRAYGNYLGICRLGQFVAHELGLPFTRMTCVAAAARLGDHDWTKQWARAQLDLFRQALAEPGSAIPSIHVPEGSTP